MINPSAVEGGADRLEICGNLPLCGGSTPSLGLVKIIKKSFPLVPLMVCGSVEPRFQRGLTHLSHCFQVMVRPRVGDFAYSAQEFETMIEDVRSFRALGVSGIVSGILLPDGSVDRERCAKWVQCLKRVLSNSLAYQTR